MSVFTQRAIVKMAISIPDELFESAERFAGRQGMSRSELYATALRYYLQEEHRSEGIIEQLDAIYGTEDGSLEPTIALMQAQSLPEGSW